MIITFYGVRGSTAAPGPMTVKYGGNTSCVHIELESGHDLILDAGTGIRLLGKKLASKSTPPTYCCHTVTGITFRVTRFLHRFISPIVTFTCISVWKKGKSY